ncbi:TetR/AcrR family transcriptional regulator C-terminal domain-containing protein [Kribbella sp. NPDC051586]|uniref:TetR/AcrR family transcriptional regulator C-terminal domain-containing protein n=1 Tax=Kribbella sp. NPDC051586 TaxID=3364118 RepID=UPI00378EB53D
MARRTTDGVPVIKCHVPRSRPAARTWTSTDDGRCETARAPATQHRRATSARAVLRRHRWAIGLLESRSTPGPATLRHHDAVIATLRAAGFSQEMTAHAYALIDSYTYGFALQEAALPFEGPETVATVAEPIMERFAAGNYPHLVEMATGYYLEPGYDFGDEFGFGLELILDGLARSLG